MNVAYVCADPGVPVFGRKGASVHVQEVIRAMLARGVSVTLFARRFGGAPPTGLADVAAVQLPAIGGVEGAARERALVESNNAITSMLRARGGFDLVYERHSLWCHAAMEFAQDSSVPGVLEVNAPLIDEQARYRALCEPELARSSSVRSFRAATVIAAVSADVAAYVRGQVPEHGRVHILPNGVDPARFKPESAARQALPERTIGFVGTLKPWHGVDILLDAFGLLSRAGSVRLLLVGDGPERTALETRATALGLGSAVEFTGAVDPEAVPAYLASMDVAVAPYPSMEGFYFSPLKLYEYMAAGCAIVASDIGQIRDVVEHGRTGLLVEPGNSRALAGAISELLADPHRRRLLGESARAAAVERHSWSRVVDRVLQLSGMAIVGAGA
jgi:glycosyltransferase involved in cell wall biosynthesis